MSTLFILIVFTVAGALPAHAQGTLDEAQRSFYNGQYQAADALTLNLCSADLEGLEGCELRSSTLLFQIKRVIAPQADKNAALKACVPCANWISSFRDLTVAAQTLARARLKAVPDDDATRFLLGKIDLNYVWLQLGVLGHKTGWSEYWEARKSLDAVLKVQPEHVRARVARAWIDYIVDTEMPRGTRWVLGGGNKKRGLNTVREAAGLDGDTFVQAEAGFALWDMQVREKNIAGAILTARGLAREFPQNEELRKFLAAHDAVSDASDLTGALPVQ